MFLLETIVMVEIAEVVQVFSLFTSFVRLLFKILRCCKKSFREAQKIKEQYINRDFYVMEVETLINEANFYYSQGKLWQAIKTHVRALEIVMKIGGREDLALAVTYCGNIATSFMSLGEYAKAQRFFKKAIKISREICDRQAEASNYENLGILLYRSSVYAKAEEFLLNGLAIRQQDGDKHQEATDYETLAIVAVFQYLGDYDKAEAYHEKALEARRVIGDKNGEASANEVLAGTFRNLAEYVKAEKYLERALSIRKEIGDRKGQAVDCGQLGAVFFHLGEYVKAKEYLQDALSIREEVDYREGEALDFQCIGNVFSSLGDYAKAEEYCQKALEITAYDDTKEASSMKETKMALKFLADRALQPLVDFFVKDECTSDQQHTQQAYVQTVLAVQLRVLRNVLIMFKPHFDRNELDSDNEIARECGKAFRNLEKLEDLFQKCLRGEDDRDLELILQHSRDICEGYGKITLEPLAFSNGQLETLLSTFIGSGGLLQVWENLFKMIPLDEDEVFCSLSSVFAAPCQLISMLLCKSGNPIKALYVAELGRARTLALLMSAQYSVGNHIAANPQSWVGIENIMTKERDSTCLYISYFTHNLFLWVLDASKPTHFELIDTRYSSIERGLVKDFHDFLKDESFRGFKVPLNQHCEDRSLLALNLSKSDRTAQEDKRAPRPPVEEDDQSSLTLCYQLIIARVAKKLENFHEIIIVPDRSLYKVPFAALIDENGKYLSETFRIRIVPSLTTLKIIQDRPADNGTETNALIVGNPDVSEVSSLTDLTFARVEAQMIGNLLGVRPLIGPEATKLAVLEMIHSADLIHFAAHGDAERGEIALSPVRPVRETLRREDYLLTMSDVSQVQLRAKLVVLSCCHTARGNIVAEGVVGIARAILGSGARSVLVALWAIEDKATEIFMRHFYKHLIRGESASESLHKTRKLMRGSNYSHVRQWAPFELIGDNVTFDFGK